MKWTSQRITLVLLTVLLGASLVYTFSQYRQANTARLQLKPNARNRCSAFVVCGKYGR